MRAATMTMAALAAAGLAVAAQAQTVVDPENVRAKDVVTSPLSDINLMKREVPMVLQAALAAPYDLDGIKTCAGLTTAVADLNAALGNDIDVAQEKTGGERMGNTAGSAAKWFVGSFIPFRGIVRELSGANAQERAWQRAIYAGAVRRAFLKGMGETRGCHYPARSATPQVVASLTAQRDAARAKKANRAENTAGEPIALSYDAAAPRSTTP